MEIGLKNLRIIKEALRLTVRQMTILNRVSNDEIPIYTKECRDTLLEFLNNRDEFEITVEDVRALYNDIDTRIKNVIDIESLR